MAHSVNQELENHATALSERVTELSKALERCLEENADLQMRLQQH